MYQDGPAGLQRTAASRPRASPGYLDELLAGRVHEFDTGPTFTGAGLTLVALSLIHI